MELILTILVALAIVGFATWLVVTFVKMPAPFPQLIIGVMVFICLFYVLHKYGINLKF